MAISTGAKSEYDIQAENFLKETETTIEKKFLEYGKHFEKDDYFRDIWSITIKRGGGREFTFNFGNSVSESTTYKEPSDYSILACLQKYEVGTFENFCGDFGYDEDSRTAEKTYKAVCEEFKNIQTIWNDSEIEKLQEIS